MVASGGHGIENLRTRRRPKRRGVRARRRSGGRDDVGVVGASAHLSRPREPVDEPTYSIADASSTCCRPVRSGSSSRCPGLFLVRHCRPGRRTCAVLVGPFACSAGVGYFARLVVAPPRSWRSAASAGACDDLVQATSLAARWAGSRACPNSSASCMARPISGVPRRGPHPHPRQQRRHRRPDRRRDPHLLQTQSERAVAILTANRAGLTPWPEPCSSTRRSRVRNLSRPWCPPASSCHCERSRRCSMRSRNGSWRRGARECRPEGS